MAQLRSDSHSKLIADVDSKLLRAHVLYGAVSLSCFVHFDFFACIHDDSMESEFGHVHPAPTETNRGAQSTLFIVKLLGEISTSLNLQMLPRQVLWFLVTSTK